MARPAKKGLHYFPLDVDFLEDDKLIELMDEHGPAGAMVYLAALCTIYRAGYYVEMPRERMALCVCRMIGNRWLTRKDTLEILDFCGELGLFDKALMSQGVFTSRAIQSRYAAVTVKNKTVKDVYWLLEEKVSGEETLISGEETLVSVEETPLKKRKEKERKENERKGEETREREKDAACAAAPLSPAATPPMSYGENQNVYLTETQYQLLSTKIRNLDSLIDSLSNYMASTGKQYQNHYATLLRWDKLERSLPPNRRKERPSCSFDIEAFERQGFDLPPAP